MEKLNKIEDKLKKTKNELKENKTPGLYGPLGNRIPKAIMVNGIKEKPVFTTQYGLLKSFNSFLTAKEQVLFSHTCGWTRDKLKLTNLAHLLRVHVARGHQDTVEAMVSKYPELVLTKGEVTDYSGRAFKNISAFQYALWALDRHMWEGILKRLPQDKQGASIRAALLEQYNEVETEGVEYTLEDNITKENHFDFTRLIEALQKYVNHFNEWTFEQCKNHWCEQVGGAQYFVPAHVANEYCDSSKSFYPTTPKFDDKILARSIKFDNWITNKMESWWMLGVRDDNRLGFDFGVYGLGLVRGWRRRGGRLGGGS